MKQPGLHFDHTDFFWLKAWCNYSHSNQSLFRKIFARVSLAFLIFMCLVAWVSAVFEPQVALQVEIIHISVMDLLAITNLITDYNHGDEVGKEIDYYRNMVMDKHYSSQNETVRELYVKNMKYFLRVLFSSYVICLILYVGLKPVIGYLEGLGWTVHPVPHYFPFDINFLLACFLMGAMELAFILVYFTSVATYMGLTMQLKAQFRILSISLEEIERRVVEKLESQTISLEEARRQCLVENIKHHQEILRSYVRVRSFLNNTFSIVTLLSALFLSTKSFLFVKTLDAPGTSAGHLFPLIIELSFPFIFCFLGELLTIESEKVLDSFYEIEWYTMDRPSRSLVKTALICGSTSAVRIKSNLNLVACLRVFTSIVSSTYNFVNLLVQVET